MKELSLPYGKGFQTLRVPESRLNAVLLPHPAEEAAEDQTALILRALENPIESPRLSSLVKDKKKVVVISSDHTRPVPSRLTMPLLLEEIRKGNPEAEITILIATGMHRPTTEEELLARYGEEIVKNERIVVHKSKEQENMAFFGILPSGGELWLNRLIKEADFVLSEGFIEPHFFAGFSGGRKSILPGVASAKTVLYNHNALFIRDPHARQGNLEGNPIHKDMLFAAKAAGLQFILNVLINGEKKVVAAVAGDPDKAHLAGTAISEKMTRLSPVVSDIAVTSNGGYPLDQNVYQSVKGMTAAEASVREGGYIIMCAALGDGHGGEAFYKWFAENENADAVSSAIEGVPPENTAPDQWEAQILARVMKKATCIFVTGEENRALIEAMHMLWAPDADTALRIATEALGETSKVTVIPDGVGVIL